MEHNIKYGQYVDINGAKVWQNNDGTFEEITTIPDPKVVAWYKRGLVEQPTRTVGRK